MHTNKGEGRFRSDFTFVSYILSVFEYSWGSSPFLWRRIFSVVDKEILSPSTPSPLTGSYGSWFPDVFLPTVSQTSEWALWASVTLISRQSGSLPIFSGSSSSPKCTTSLPTFLTQYHPKLRLLLPRSTNQGRHITGSIGRTYGYCFWIFPLVGNLRFDSKFG